MSTTLRPAVSLLSMLVRRANDDNAAQQQRQRAALLKALRLGYVPWCVALQFAGGALLHTAAAVWVETAVVECDSLLGYRLAAEPRPRRRVDAAEWVAVPRTHLLRVANRSGDPGDPVYWQMLGAAVSPDCTTIATVSLDDTLRFWNADTGLLLSKFDVGGTEATIYSDNVNCVAISPTGALFATRGTDAALRVCETTSGRRMAQFDSVRDTSVTRVAFSPTGASVASASSANPARIYDWATGAERTLGDSNTWANDVAWLAGGSALATGSHEGIVRLWDADTQRELLRRDLDSPIFSLAVAPDSRHLAAGCQDSKIRVLDAATFEVRHVLQEHSSAVCAVAFSPCSRLLLSGGDDRVVRIHDVATGALVRVHAAADHMMPIQSVMWFNNSSAFATVSEDTVCVWKLAA